MREIVCDNFAGGGGASTGIEWALGQVDVAIKPRPESLGYTQGQPPEHYFRGCVEFLIFAVNKTQGNRPVCATTEKNLLWEEVPNVLRAVNPPGHSAKPDLAYEMIRRQSPGPRLSIFQRTPREGFECWGNEFPAEEPASLLEGC